MSRRLRQLFSHDLRQGKPPSVPAGERWYAIGDVHGRHDLLAALRDEIEADDAEAAEARTTIVLLGDLIDRGPDSAGVIAAVREWQSRRTVRCLAGNHEEMFLGSFTDPSVLRAFLRHGGRETLASYGIATTSTAEADLPAIQRAMASHVRVADRRFLAEAEDHIVAGDYLMVHAGIRPDRPLAEQTRADKRWIREPFLHHEGPLDYMVIHGHSITAEVCVTPNRIGIDTGAFRTGRLTALVLEGDRRRVIQAVVHSDSRILIEKGDRI